MQIRSIYGTMSAWFMSLDLSLCSELLIIFEYAHHCTIYTESTAIAFLKCHMSPAVAELPCK
jgi:hypothetical protein